MTGQLNHLRSKPGFNAGSLVKDTRFRPADIFKIRLSALRRRKTQRRGEQRGLKGLWSVVVEITIDVEIIVIS